MKILITGSSGYLGSLVAPELLWRGHDVIGIDAGFYQERSLGRSSNPTPLTFPRDIRRLQPKDLVGIEAVIHLGELSNDPAGELAPEITYEINHLGSVRLAKMAKDAKVKKFIYTSSCSVYGLSEQDGFVDEHSPVNPQTAYGVCKTLVERDVSVLADAHFSPTFLRNATAYGASPRMRFDIVLNNLAGLAWTRNEIVMTSDGTPWRPLVHALDICQAIIAVFEAPTEFVHNEIFNVGDTEHNYRIREIAEIVAEVFPGCGLKFGAPGQDNRSYRVSFEKIRNHLPGFKCKWDALRGARQLYDLFRKIAMTEADFEHRAFTRLKQLQYLLRTNQIDDHFFWMQ
jgi:nucleoside-diphosphate-sugar epimerase